MTSSQIDAITVDQTYSDPLAIRRVDLAAAQPGEITVRVTAISLNRGEVKRALTVSETGTTPGWDFVGTVEQTGGLAGAPGTGERVVGVLPAGAWAGGPVATEPKVRLGTSGGLICWPKLDARVNAHH